jgi:hypothetical protein
LKVLNVPKTVNPALIKPTYNKKFLEILIVNYPLILHGRNRRRTKSGGMHRHRQQGDLTSLLTTIRDTPKKVIS